MVDTFLHNASAIAIFHFCVFLRDMWRSLGLKCAGGGLRSSFSIDRKDFFRAGYVLDTLQWYSAMRFSMYYVSVRVLLFVDIIRE